MILTHFKQKHNNQTVHLSTPPPSESACATLADFDGLRRFKGRSLLEPKEKRGNTAVFE